MRITNEATHRELVRDDYIPLKLTAAAPCHDAMYYTVRKGDHSLLELTFDQDDAKVKRITLLLCLNSRRLKEGFSLPGSYETGDVLVDSAADEETETFECIVYDDAVEIIVSNEAVSQAVLSGNVLWNLSEEGKLISICIVHLERDVAEHCWCELQQNAVGQ